MGIATELAGHARDLGGGLTVAAMANDAVLGELGADGRSVSERSTRFTPAEPMS